MILASFLAALTAFLLIGLASAAKSRGTKDDYYLASRDVPPAMAGLSAIATNNSGYMFIGLMGFTYSVGVASLWLMVGWIVGDFLMSMVVHRRLRNIAAEHDEVTFAGVLARWSGGEFALLRRIAAVIIVLFLGAYAAAQLTAGGKTLQALLHWRPESGAVLVATMVAMYCLAGGIRASIWTDVAQSAVMIVAMAAMLAAGLSATGGVEAAWHSLGAIPGYLDPFPSELLLPGFGGAALFVTGWLFAGMSVIGQPHIMVRFMALDDPDHLNRTRVWYYGFYVVFYGMAAGVGLLSRLLLPDLHGMDPELALPTMAMQLLPPLFVGIVLAGIFAATMSTADSLVLSCSSALTHDLMPRKIEKPLELKAVTLLVVALALGIALNGTQSVFVLVILAWSALASAFGPLIFLHARGHHATQTQAIVMMLVGLGVCLGWRALGWQDMVYEGMPGMLAGWATYYLTRPLSQAAMT
jgi:SSS family solute:Na+ symporter/sodium/proline symporter